MFDKNVFVDPITPSTTYNNTTINENRAPTDDSIRLYGEMLNKAKEAVLDTIVVNNNTLNFKAVLFKDHLLSNTTCYYEVVLNNNTIEGKVVVKDYNLTTKHTREVLTTILKKVSEHIAVDLLQMALQNEK